MGNSNLVKPPFKERLHLAVSGIMEGYLLLEEAVDKYDIPPSSIIKALKKIQKLKKAALTEPGGKKQLKTTMEQR